MSEHTTTAPHPSPLCPAYGTDAILLGCPCMDRHIRSCQNDNDHPSVQAVIAAAVELADAPTDRVSRLRHLSSRDRNQEDPNG